MGARPLRRTIQREIEDQLSEKILFGEIHPGDIVVVDVDGEGDDAKFTFAGNAKPRIPERRASCPDCRRTIQPADASDRSPHRHPNLASSAREHTAGVAFP